MRKRGNKFVVFTVLILGITLGLLGIAVSQVFAGEGGGNNYPGGNEDFMVGALPPAGTSVFINYVMSYNATTLRDNAGRKAVLNGPPGNPEVDFNLNVLANVFRYVKVTNVKLFGGDVLWHALLPVVYQKVGIDVSPFLDLGSQSKYGLGDITAGAGIAWHPSKTFHHAAGFDVVAPTGAYDKSDLSNIGRNYWSFSPIYAFTYIGDKDSPLPGFEVSSKFMYYFNTINSATSYTSGQEFIADYLVGQHFGKWAFGINGYFLYQTTDDKDRFGTAVDNFSGLKTGVRGRTLSIGPAISYNIPHGSITLKYQRDVIAQNRAEGDKFWLKWVYAF